MDTKWISQIRNNLAAVAGTGETKAIKGKETSPLANHPACQHRNGGNIYVPVGSAMRLSVLFTPETTGDDWRGGLKEKP